MADYGIRHESSIYEFARSADEIKYRLLQLGLSTKALEGVSLFGDSFTSPADATKATAAVRMVGGLAG
jgi:hypothetical protein